MWEGESGKSFHLSFSAGTDQGVGHQTIGPADFQRMCLAGTQKYSAESEARLLEGGGGVCVDEIEMCG